MENSFTLETLGMRLKLARKKSKLSQQAIAEMLGIHETTYIKYEGNKREPKPDVLIKFKQITGVDWEYLMEGKNRQNQRSFLKELFKTVQEPHRSKLIEMIEVSEKVEIIRLELIGSYIELKIKYADYISQYMDNAEERETKTT